MRFYLFSCAIVALGLTPFEARADRTKLTLPTGGVQGTVSFERDASTATADHATSVAPDLAVGVSDDLTISLVHSTFGRTGFRGAAGAGVCATAECENRYDNVGLEGLYSIVRGPFAVAANGGIHATSFDREHYAAKLGAKLRYRVGIVTLTSNPSVALAMTERDATMPNRDRIFMPVGAMVRVAGPLSAGLVTGFKAPLDAVSESYEIAAGAMLQYTFSPALGMGASWVHGKLLGGEMALPDDTIGWSSRAVHVWITATH